MCVLKQILRFQPETIIMSSQNKINLILAWADSRPWFDTHFVKNVEEHLHEYEHLTMTQEAALDRILDKFHIEEEEENDDDDEQE